MINWEDIKSGQTYQTVDGRTTIIWHVFRKDSISIDFCGYTEYFTTRRFEYLHNIGKEDFKDLDYMGTSGIYRIAVNNIKRNNIINCVFNATSFRSR